MKFTPNFSEAEPIKSGIYLVKVMECDSHISQNNNPYLRWKLKITGTEFDGRYVWINTVLKGTGAGILKQFLLAINPNYQFSTFDVEDCLGKMININLSFNGSSKGYPDVISMDPVTKIN